MKMRCLTDGLAKRRSVLAVNLAGETPRTQPRHELFIFVGDVWFGPQSAASSIRTTHTLMF